MPTKPPFSEDLPASVHGTSLSVSGKGVLIIGPSGSGKSSLAFQLMAYGAKLISDDLTWIDKTAQLSRPPGAEGPVQIEARNFGILSVKPTEPAPFQLLIDLSVVETARLPETVSIKLAGRSIRCIHKVDNPAFPAMVLQYLKNDQM